MAPPLEVGENDQASGQLSHKRWLSAVWQLQPSRRRRHQPVLGRRPQKESAFIDCRHRRQRGMNGRPWNVADDEPAPARLLGPKRGR